MFLNFFNNLQGSYDKEKLRTQSLNECLEQTTIQAANLLNYTETTCTPFKAVVSETQTLVNEDTPIIYVDNENQVHYLILFKGLNSLS